MFRKLFKLFPIIRNFWTREIFTLRFAKSGIEDGIINDLFPHRSKYHNMKTRKGEHYKVTHANTERFRNSPILTMQRMLNTDIRENI